MTVKAGCNPRTPEVVDLGSPVMIRGDAMAQMKVTVRLAITIVVLAAVGCGKGVNTMSVADSDKEELIDVYETYSEYLKSNQKPPKQLSDLKKYEAIHALALRVLRDGKYVVAWGVNGKDSGTILAYPKDAPTQGGQVLMADGTIKNMSADELKSQVK
jgi:hypothetical protein